MQDIIIVGAGMVGLSCALFLARNGISLTLIEANPHPCQSLPTATEDFDVKVVAINRSSQQLFEKLDVWSVIKATRACAYQQMKVWDSVADGLITFCANDYFESDLGHIIEQKVILAALWQALKKHPQVAIHYGKKISRIDNGAECIQAFLDDGTAISAKLLIAADGARSTARDLCHIDLKRWDYQQTAIVATVKGEKSHQLTAFQRFAKDGPLALLPLSEPNIFSIVWTTTPENAFALCQKSRAEFDEILTRESGYILGKLQTLSERHRFPLYAQQAQQYVISRCVLVGDAAHTLHPLAGQGVNLGLGDVSCLLEILLKIKAKSRDYGVLSALLPYQRRRKLHNQIMIMAMDGFKRGFGSANNLIRTFRNVGLNWVDQQHALKQLFMRLAQGT